MSKTPTHTHTHTHVSRSFPLFISLSLSLSLMQKQKPPWSSNFFFHLTLFVWSSQSTSSPSPPRLPSPNLPPHQLTRLPQHPSLVHLRGKIVIRCCKNNIPKQQHFLQQKWLLDGYLLETTSSSTATLLLNGCNNDACCQTSFSIYRWWRGSVPCCYPAHHINNSTSKSAEASSCCNPWPFVRSGLFCFKVVQANKMIPARQFKKKQDRQQG